MSGACRVEFKFDDYLAANWLVFRKRALFRNMIRLFATSWLAMLVLTFVLSPTTAPVKVVISLCGGLGSVIGWLVCVRWSIPRAARKSFDQIHGHGLMTEYTFDEEKFTASNRLGLATLEWPLVSFWLQSPKLLIVWASTGILYIFPSDQVDSDVLENLRSTLIAAGVRRG